MKISQCKFNKFVAIVDRFYTYDKADDYRVSGKYFAINFEANTTVYTARLDNGKIYFSFRNTVTNDRFYRMVGNYREYNELVKIIKTFVK